MNRSQAQLSNSLHKHKSNFNIKLSDKNNLDNRTKNIKNILNVYSSKSKIIIKKPSEPIIDFTYEYKREDKIKTSR